MPEPSTSLAITLHSMCHPGRPGPHGESHAGSPGFDDFHSAKSAEDRFPVVLVRDPAERLLAQSCSHASDQGMTGWLTFPILEQFPVALAPGLQLRVAVVPLLLTVRTSLRAFKLDGVEPDAAAALVRISAFDDAFDEFDDLGDVLRHPSEGRRSLDMQGAHRSEERVFPERGQVAENRRICDVGSELQQRKRFQSATDQTGCANAINTPACPARARARHGLPR